MIPFIVAIIFAGSARAQDFTSDDGEVDAVPVLTDLSPRDTIVLFGEDLIHDGYNTLGEALAFQVGFARERTSRGYRYALRGVPAGVLLVVDGVPQLVDGERDVLDVDEVVSLLDVDRVEIVRGPVTALTGAGALTGVVRITTMKPGLSGASARVTTSWLGSDVPAFGQQTAEASATVRAGDAGVRVSGRIAGGGPAEEWRIHGAPTRYEQVSTDPRQRFGIVLPVTKVDVNEPIHDDVATLAAAAQWSDLTLTAGYAHSVERAPLSAFSHGLVVGLGADDPQAIARDLLHAQLGWQRWLGPVHIEVELWGAGQMRDDDGPLYPKQGVFQSGGDLDVVENADTGGALARVDVPITHDHRVVASAFVDGSKLDASSSSHDPRTGKELPDQVTLDDATATGAFALEWQGDLGAGIHATAGIAAEARTAFPIALAPRAAVSFTPDDAWALRASYSEGTRAPDRYDITALAQTVVDGRVVGAASNDELRPEHVRMLELSTSYAPTPALALDVRAYGLRHEDALVEAVENGLLVPENLAPRIAVGAEATASVQPFGPEVSLEAGLAAEGTVNGPSIGEDFAQAIAGVRVQPVAWLHGGLRLRALARDPGTSALVDAYLVVNPIASIGDAIGVTLAVQNLLDGNELSIDRAAPPQADPVLYPSPGRIITLGLEGHL
ncbi:MAG TPA: TonB-dependent receptor [Myxococcota bacterium]